MVSPSNRYWKRVQRHQIDLGIWYQHIPILWSGHPKIFGKWPDFWGGKNKNSLIDSKKNLLYHIFLTFQYNKFFIHENFKNLKKTPYFSRFFFKRLLLFTDILWCKILTFIVASQQELYARLRAFSTCNARKHIHLIPKSFQSWFTKSMDVSWRFFKSMNLSLLGAFCFSIEKYPALIPSR